MYLVYMKICSVSIFWDLSLNLSCCKSATRLGLGLELELRVRARSWLEIVIYLLSKILGSFALKTDPGLTNEYLRCM